MIVRAIEEIRASAKTYQITACVSATARIVIYPREENWPTPHGELRRSLLPTALVQDHSKYPKNRDVALIRADPTHAPMLEPAARPGAPDRAATAYVPDRAPDRV